MKLIKQSHEILYIPTREDALRLLEIAGRTCYRSDPGDAARLIRGIIKRGHESVLEHCSVMVRFITDRAVLAELTRHRIGVAFSVESQRYVNYSKWKNGGCIEFVEPWNWDSRTEDRRLAELTTLRAIESEYLNQISFGASPQEAREVLPNCTATRIVMTANFREMRHILKLRTANDAHPQMRALMIPLANELATAIPEVFGEETK